MQTGTTGGGMPGGANPSGGTTGLAPNIASLLAYICPPITGIIFILLEKDNQDVKFHAWQGASLGVVFIAAIIALEILAAIFGAIAAFLGGIITFFIPIIGLIMTILWVVCLVKAYQGEKWRIPFIGDFAAKKAGL